MKRRSVPAAPAGALMATGRLELLLAACCCLVLIIPAGTATAAEPQAGTASSIVSEWHGKVVFLDFWASWCGPCRESFPWMAGMTRKYSDRGLVIVAVNLDQDRAAADAFLEGTDYPFNYVYDAEGTLAQAHDVQTMPSSVLFSRDGTPVYRHAGFRLDEATEYEERIVALLEGRGGEPVATSKPARRRKLGARPWERDLLAAKDMSLNTDPLDLDFDDHLYFSREASSGGRGFGGGGCGCN